MLQQVPVNESFPLHLSLVLSGIQSISVQKHSSPLSLRADARKYRNLYRHENRAVRDFIGSESENPEEI